MVSSGKRLSEGVRCVVVLKARNRVVGIERASRASTSN